MMIKTITRTKQGYPTNGATVSQQSPRNHGIAVASVVAAVLLAWRLYTRWTVNVPPTFVPPQVTNTTAMTRRVPRVVHQTYKTTTLPEVWKDSPSKWNETNPFLEYRFWTDEANRNLIEAEYPWFLETYDNYPYPIQRADAARYFILLKHGGLYCDLDIIPRCNLESLYQWLDYSSQQAELIVAQTYNLGLTNALVAAVPQSPVLQAFVESLQNKTWWHALLPPHFKVMLAAGPTRFWMFLRKGTARDDKVLTLSAAGWGQCHQCRRTCQVASHSYFTTLEGGSWHKWDTRIFNAALCFPQVLVWLLLGVMFVVEQVLVWHLEHTTTTLVLFHQTPTVPFWYSFVMPARRREAFLYTIVLFALMV